MFNPYDAGALMKSIKGVWYLLTHDFFGNLFKQQTADFIARSFYVAKHARYY
jgi:hypothetical protein